MNLKYDIDKVNNLLGRYNLKIFSMVKVYLAIEPVDR